MLQLHHTTLWLDRLLNVTNITARDRSDRGGIYNMGVGRCDAAVGPRRSVGCPRCPVGPERTASAPPAIQ